MNAKSLATLGASLLLAITTTACATEQRRSAYPLVSSAQPRYSAPILTGAPPLGPPPMSGFAQPRYLPAAQWGAPPSGPPPGSMAYAPSLRNVSPPATPEPPRKSLSVSDVVLGGLIAWGLYQAVTAPGGGEESAAAGENPITRMMEAEMESD